MASIKYKTEDGYVSIPLNIIGSRVYLEDYDDGEVVPELVDDNAKLGNGIGTCSTSSGTALEVTLDNYKLVKNGIIAVTFEYDVPANATLNINNKGAKAIYNEGSAIEADVIKAGKTVMFAYDGTNYVVTSLGGGGSNSEFVGIKLEDAFGNMATVIGATVVITNTDTSEIILSTTWQGNIIVTEVSEGVNYTITVGNVNHYTIFTNTINHTAVPGFSFNATFLYQSNYAYVDLGLPSGTKWYPMNIGADTPEEYGQYFSWGNTDGHYSTEGYNFSSNNYNLTTGAGLTGDIPSGSSTYDAARVNMNEPWRMPTIDEWKELRDNTTNANYTLNGVAGRLFTSKINTGSIFFPYSGIYVGTTASSIGTDHLSWATKMTALAYGGICSISNNGTVNLPGLGSRYNGCTIRAVR